MVKIKFTNELSHTITLVVLKESTGMFFSGIEDWLHRHYNAYILPDDGKPYLYFFSDKKATEFVLKYG